MIKKIFSYEDNKVSFRKNGHIMINATEMAKPFGKKVVEWLRLPSTQEFLAELSKVGKSHLLIHTEKGRYGGTWFNEDVAIEFARWINVRFAIWCNDRIKELMTTGVAVLSVDGMSRADILEIAAKAERDKEAAVKALDVAQVEIKELSPYAEVGKTLTSANGEMSLGDAAKMLKLGYGRNKLYENLRSDGIMMKLGKHNVPMQAYVDAGYFKVDAFKVDGYVFPHTKVTPRGLKYLYHLYGKRPVPPQRLRHYPALFEDCLSSPAETHVPFLPL